MSGVDVKVETTDDAVRVILVGDVDLGNVDRVATDIHSAITNQVTAATVDLSDVGYLDSAGLRVLFELAVRLPTLQITLVLVAPPGSPARRVVDMSGLSGVATVVP
ncbi:MAG TPA: STAS domain-containing protein [Acidimicrobiales bacterium]